MSSLSSLVIVGGPIAEGDPDGPDVVVAQLAISAAGYRISPDSHFGPRTEQAVKQFQIQHGLSATGIIDLPTAGMLDRPHDILVSMARPMSTPGGEWPHDDTASLLAFYGKPWADSSLVTNVIPSFPITYEGKRAKHIPFHVKAAPSLKIALDKIAAAAKSDPSILKHVSKWSGSGNYRPVRGSSRLSTHAFWAANDFDAEHLPLGKGVPASEMPQIVVDIFKSTGCYWGGDYTGRKDPMHFQYAHE